MLLLSENGNNMAAEGEIDGLDFGKGQFMN